MAEAENRPPDFVCLREQDLELLLEAAATKGAKAALGALGLHDEDAGDDIRDLRKLMGNWRVVRAAAGKWAVEAAGNVATKAILAVLAAFAGGAAVSWWRS